jgi:hypothetical protein
MELSLIGDLNESRMFRTKQAFKKVTARQLADAAFMDIIALWILTNEYAYAPSAIEYARKTIVLGRFDTLQQSQTDLYLELHVLMNKKSELLSDRANADSILLDRLHINKQDIITYLRKLATNQLTPSITRMTFQKLERDLMISDSNYRSVRRLAQEWQKLDTTQKRLVITRMTMFYQRNAPMSDIFLMLRLYAKSAGLISAHAANPEKLSTVQAISAVAIGAAAGWATGWAIGSRLL